MSGSSITSPGPDDLLALRGVLAFDQVAGGGDQERVSELKDALAGGRLRVAWREATPVGYTVLAPWWFGASFLQLLYVDADHRRTGIARDLIGDATQRVQGRLFTSTNESNLPMRALLSSLGWQRCGDLEGLDEGDPEVFYRTG